MKTDEKTVNQLLENIALIYPVEVEKHRHKELFHITVALTGETIVRGSSAISILGSSIDESMFTIPPLSEEIAVCRCLLQIFNQLPDTELNHKLMQETASLLQSFYESYQNSKNRELFPNVFPNKQL
jgi:hypothetical protein